jgi:hypothetical protein
MALRPASTNFAIVCSMTACRAESPLPTNDDRIRRATNESASSERASAARNRRAVGEVGRALRVDRDGGRGHRHGQLVAVAVEDDPATGLQHRLGGALLESCRAEFVRAGDLQVHHTRNHEQEEQHGDDEDSEQAPTRPARFEPLPAGPRRVDDPTLERTVLSPTVTAGTRCGFRAPAGRGRMTSARRTGSWRRVRTLAALHRCLVAARAPTRIGGDARASGGNTSVVAGTGTLGHGCTSRSAFTARNWASSSASFQ